MRITPEHITEGLATGTCDVCGGDTLPHGAFWHGERTIEVCHECAPTLAAALVIDSAPAAGPMRVKNVTQDVERLLWRAATYRAARETDRQLQPSRN